MPFGLGLADWDVLLTDEQLKMFFRQLAIVNSCPSTVLALVVHFTDAGRVAKAMEEHGYIGVHPFYVYKPTQNQRGTECFIFAVEMVLIGYLATPSERKLNFPDPNPLDRHNLLFGHSLRGPRFQLSGDQAPVNTCQKHTGVAHYLASVFAHPGANALVIGAGSGSDVIGCVRASLNVFAVEKDPGQFRGCKARLMGYQSNLEAEQKVEAKELDQVSHLKAQARAFASWDPESADAPEEKSASSSSSSSSSSSAVVETKCCVCGEALGDSAMVECGAESCAADAIHETCSETCSAVGCSEVFCCKSHLQTHVDSVHAA